MKNIISHQNIRTFCVIIVSISVLVIAVALFSDWYIRYDCSNLNFNNHEFKKLDAPEKLSKIQRCAIYNKWGEDEYKMLNKVTEIFKKIEEK